VSTFILFLFFAQHMLLPKKEGSVSAVPFCRELKRIADRRREYVQNFRTNESRAANRNQPNDGWFLQLPGDCGSLWPP